MKQRTYIIGHKNPDTDSIAAAIGYEHFKKTKGDHNCMAARAGKVNPQTEYILNRLNISPPKLITDLTPRVSTYMTEEPLTVSRDMPLWEALKLMNKKSYKMLPIVDENNRFISALHYNAFAQKMLQKIDPHVRTVIPTSLNHIVKTIGAQTLTLCKSHEEFHGRIVIAASDMKTVTEHVEALPRESVILMVGNREDIQDYAITQGIRCLIITGARAIKRELVEKAEKNNVSVIISPFDTSATSLMVFYSIPAVHMGDSTIIPLKINDYIKSIRNELLHSLSRSLPVVDEKGITKGILSRGDILKDPPIDLILVDHNELTQSVDGAEHYAIKEIIDHHRLGNVHTSLPITFINRPVGSTSTIIAELFLEQKIPLPVDIASLLLGGIISDTLILRSATTTKTDHDIAQYLGDITGLSVDTYGKDIMESASIVSKKPIEEILHLDLKIYTEKDHNFSVSQIEVVSPSALLDKKDEILQKLYSIAQKNNYLFASLMVTDITKLSSYLIISGNDDLIKNISFEGVDEGIFNMKNILSRKKQLVPYFSEVISSFE